MKDFLDKHKSELRLTALAAIVVALLLIVHSLGLAGLLQSEVTKNLENDARVAARVLSESLGDYEILAGQGAHELGFLALNDEKTIRGKAFTSTLSGYASSFNEVYYVSNEGVIYDAYGRTFPIPDTELFQRLTEHDLENPGQTLIIPGFMGDGYSNIVYFSPVRQYNRRVGYFAGELKLSSDFVANLKDYLESGAVMYLLDEEGNVIASADTDCLGPDFQDLHNLNSYLMGSLSREEDRTNFSGVMSGEAGEEGYLQLENDQGNGTLGMAYCKLDGISDLTVVGISPTNRFMGLLFSQRKIEALLLLFDILLIVIITSMSIFSSVMMQRRIMKEAYTDPLTGAGTRNYFRKVGQELLDSHPDIRYAVAAVDVVGFRYVNELFGHERGDEILRMMTNMMMEFKQPREILARNTGDYFELLLTTPELFGQRMLQVSDRLNEYARSIDVTYPLQIRAGYCIAKTMSQRKITDLLDKANAARRVVNTKKGILVQEYSGEMQDEVRLRDEIESAMDSALAHEEFKMFLQPKFDLRTNRLSGAEALVRWIKRDGSMVFPDKFIPVFEQNGFIEKLDFYMLEQVCKFQKRMEEQGLERVPISVNQSRVLLLNPEYVNNVMRVLNIYRLPRNIVELELTETAFFDDQDKMIGIMEQLKENGCILDIDDFGSGFSSLNMLKDIPFDILKIDRAFFGSGEKSEKARIILEKIVDLAGSLGKECICEGVETIEQVEMLRRIGCSYGQGYYYSKPIPVEDFLNKYYSGDAGKE